MTIEITGTEKEIVEFLRLLQQGQPAASKPKETKETKKTKKTKKTKVYLGDGKWDTVESHLTRGCAGQFVKFER